MIYDFYVVAICTKYDNTDLLYYVVHLAFPQIDCLDTPTLQLYPPLPSIASTRYRHNTQGAPSCADDIIVVTIQWEDVMSLLVSPIR